MSNTSRYIEKEFLNTTELIDKSVKSRTVNSIKQKLKDLKSITTDTLILNMIETLEQICEDAYIIDMYKFQFKLFTLSIQKEISNLEELIND